VSRKACCLNSSNGASKTLHSGRPMDLQEGGSLPSTAPVLAPQFLGGEAVVVVAVLQTNSKQWQEIRPATVPVVPVVGLQQLAPLCLVRVRGEHTMGQGLHGG
jgi:hypothetical protein